MCEEIHHQEGIQRAALLLLLLCGRMAVAEGRDVLDPSSKKIMARHFTAEPTANITSCEQSNYFKLSHRCYYVDHPQEQFCQYFLLLVEMMMREKDRGTRRMTKKSTIKRHDDARRKR
uniref:Uncharacterized protein n=1 Tax=Grammatophora oceanica TaxID=210454 RepID=A0A7S1UW56_9STRA|mmetsp:Transcript_2356/g.3191  ORF Transcript_2356/g.3191 Transcript_2356/m.3191 type:complete len:118 (+) Transcript_2356:68-421(+)